MNGAIVDELRRLDWAPRSVRRAERETEQTRERFQAKDGRPPSETELAGDAGSHRRRPARALQRARARRRRVARRQKVSGNESSVAEIGDTIEASELETNPSTR